MSLELSRLPRGLHFHHHHPGTDRHADHREQPDARHARRAAQRRGHAARPRDHAGRAAGWLVLGHRHDGRVVTCAARAQSILFGWKLLRVNAGFGAIGTTPKPRGGFFLQGFLALMSNPKALLWVRRVHPAIRRSGRQLRWQIVLLGITATVTAAVTDGAMRCLAGAPDESCPPAHTARLTAQRLVPDRGGVWLAFTRPLRIPRQFILDIY